MFVSVNGLALDVEYGTWKEERIHVGDFGDLALSGRPPESRAGIIRRWTCKLTPHAARAAGGGALLTPDPVTISKVAQWIEGRGQCWSFDSGVHTYSAAGVTASVSGTFTPYATGGAHGGRLLVASGDKFGVEMRGALGVRRGWTPASGWSLLCWRKFQSGESASAGWHNCILTGAVDFARGSASNPTGVTQYLDGVAGSYSLGRCFSVSATTPFVGLHGYLTTNSAAAAEYDDFMFLPFELPASWIGLPGQGPDNSITDYMDNFPLPGLPRVSLGGDCLDPLGGNLTVPVIGRAVSSEDVQVVASTGIKVNLPILDVRFTEWLG